MDKWYDRAKRRMREIKVTQEALVKPLSVETRGAVGHYLSGRRDPTPDQLIALAQALRMSLDELLTGAGLAPDQPAARNGIDADRAAIVFEVVRRELLDVWAELPAKDQAALFASLYSLMRDDGSIDMKRILTLIDNRQGGVHHGEKRSRRSS